MKINKSIRNKCYSLGGSNTLCCTWTKHRFTVLFVPIDRGVLPGILSSILENSVIAFSETGRSQFCGLAWVVKKLVIWKFPKALYKHSTVSGPVSAIVLCISEHIYFICSSEIILLQVERQKRSCSLELGQTSLKEISGSSWLL